MFHGQVELSVKFVQFKLIIPWKILKCFGTLPKKHGFLNALCVATTSSTNKPVLWGFVLLLWPSHWPSRVPVDFVREELMSLFFAGKNLSNCPMSAMISMKQKDAERLEFRIAGSKTHLIFRVDTSTS